MKKIRLLTLMLSLTAVTSSAFAGMYTKAILLYNNPESLDMVANDQDYDVALDESAGIAVALGYKLTAFRVEAEAIYLKSEVSDSYDFGLSGEVKNYNLFGNVYFDIPSIPVIKPYIGAGVGLASIRAEGFSIETSQANYDENKTVLGFQLMAGVRATILGHASVHLGYRYLNMENTDLGAATSAISAIRTGGSHMIELGIGLGF